MGQLKTVARVSRDRRLVLVAVSDEDLELEAQFMFRRDGKGAFRLASLEISTSEPDDTLRVTDIRKTIPLGAWEEAARVRAAIALKAVEKGGGGPMATSNASGKPPYAEVARRYRELARAGVRAPAALIAQEFGVAPVTARNWLRQCRAYSLLGAAPAPGTPGEIPLKTGRKKTAPRTTNAKGGV